MLRPALAALSLLLLTGCGLPRPDARTADQRDRLGAQVNCREEADRVVTRQDRGQLMREDERNARLGSESGPYGMRTQLDQLGRQYQRDRMAEECLRTTQRAAPDQTPAAPAR